MTAPEVHLWGPAAHAAWRRVRAALPLGSTSFAGWPQGSGSRSILVVDATRTPPDPLMERLVRLPRGVTVLAALQPGIRLEGQRLWQVEAAHQEEAAASLALALVLATRKELPPTAMALRLRGRMAEEGMQPSGSPRRLASQALPDTSLPGPWAILDPLSPLDPETSRALEEWLWPWKSGTGDALEAARDAWSRGRWPLAWMADSLSDHLDSHVAGDDPEAATRALVRITDALSRGPFLPCPTEDDLPVALAERVEEVEGHNRSLLLDLVRAKDLALAPAATRLREEGWELRRRHLPDPAGLWSLVKTWWERLEDPASRAPTARTSDRPVGTPPPPHRRHGGIHEESWFEPIGLAREGAGWVSSPLRLRSLPSLPNRGWRAPARKDISAELKALCADLVEPGPEGPSWVWGEGSLQHVVPIPADPRLADALLERLAINHARTWWRGPT